MTAGPVNQALLQSFYQNAGQVYDDNKTEGAFGTLSNQIDDNWYSQAALISYVNSLVTAGTLSPVPPDAFLRQSLINSNFSIWQRGVSIAVPNGASRYGPDRWLAFRGSFVAGLTISRQNATLNGSSYCARVQRDAGNTDTTNTISFSQALPSIDSILLRGQNLVFSFYARAGANFSGSNIAITVVSGTGTDQNIISITGSVNVIASATTLTGTWTRYIFTSSGTVPLDSSQIMVLFNYLPTGTAGANDYFEVTQVQLNAGLTAPPYQGKSLEAEYEACLPYTYVPDTSGSSSVVCLGTAGSTTLASMILNFPVPMRVIPTLSVTPSDWSVADTANSPIVTTSLTRSSSGSTKNAANLGIAVAAGLTAFRPYFLIANAANKIMIFDAEF